MRRLRMAPLALAALAAVLALMAAGDVPKAYASSITAGYDLFETDPSQTFQDLNLPPDFFGPGCDPFAGRVFLQGVPMDSFDPDGPAGPLPPVTDLSPTDTIVQRMADAGPPFPATIPIEIVALNLVSAQPITVMCGGLPSFWDVQAVIDPGPPVRPPQQLGSMTISHQGINGGTFTSVLPVQPMFTFTQVKGPGIIGPFPSPFVLNFQSNGVPWCGTPNPLTDPPGHVVIDRPPLTGNFFPGIAVSDIPTVVCAFDPVAGTVTRNKVLVRENALFASHGVRVAEKKPHYKCYSIAGPAPAVPPVTLVTQFGLEPNVPVGPPLFLCPPALKNNQGDLKETHLKCYQILGQDPPHIVNLKTQFGLEQDVAVGQAQLLCVPALKEVVFPQPQPAAGPLPASPHYKCYQITGPAPNIPVQLETQFGLEPNVIVGQPILLCAPALKNGVGDLKAPHLKCYQILGDDPPHIVNLTTQFGVEPNVPVGQATMLCIPAKKEIPKGDSDGDGHRDTDETAKGADRLDAASAPEHCDGVDNDGDGIVDEPPAGSGRPTPDPLCDPAADPDGDTIPNAIDTDDDGDGFSDVVEQFMTTDELDPCSNPPLPTLHDGWPTDTDRNRTVNIVDVISVKPVFNSSLGQFNYDSRKDLTANGVINIVDVLQFKASFGKSCV